MRHRIAVILGVVAVLGSRAGAQSNLMEIPVGTRVRLQVADSLPVHPIAPRAQLVQGRLLDVRGDTLTLLPYGAPAPSQFLRSSVRRADVSRGAPRWRSMLLQGLAVGALTLTTADIATRDNPNRSMQALRHWGAAGAVVGLTAGAVRPYEQWRRIRP